MKAYFKPAQQNWRHLAVLVIVIAGLWTRAAWAQTSPAYPSSASEAPLRRVAAEMPPAITNLTLAQAVETALRDNPQLQSLAARWAAWRERPARERALPNPMSVYGGMDKASGGNFPGTDERRLMLQQEFPFFGKLSLRGGIAEKDAEILRHEVEALTLDVIMMVKEAYFELDATRRAIAITREEESVIRRLEKIAEIMYATGKRAQVDVLKAQSEVTILKQKLLDLEAREITLQAKLNTLLNRPAAAFLGPLARPVVDFPVEDDVQRLFTAAAANRPEIKAAQAQIERDKLVQRLANREFFPDYKLGAEYRDFAQGDNLFMFTVGVDLPIWLTKYRAGVREARKMVASSSAARVAAERQTSFDVQDAHFKFLTARRTLALYSTELIPQAETRFAASEAGYRTGKVDFLDLLESERFLLNARIMAVITEGGLGSQAARLERAVASALATPAELSEGQ